MRPNYYFFLSCFLLIISCVLTLIVVANCSKSSKAASDIQTLKNPNGVILKPFDLNGVPLNPFDEGSPRRALLSYDEKHAAFIVASNDGMVYLVDDKSWDIKWGFSSGPPLFSSYQAQSLPGAGGRTDSHINPVYVNKQWLMVWKGPNITAEMEHPMTPEEFSSKAPYIFDGQIILVSKSTKIFVVDATSGRMINEHTLDKSQPNKQAEDNRNFGNLVESTNLDWKPFKPLYLSRADYFLQSSPISDPKVVSWNMSISVISVVSERLVNHVSRGLKYEGDPKMLMTDQSGDDTPHIRDGNNPEANVQMHGGEMVPFQHERALPGPNSDVNMPDEYKNPYYTNWWSTMSMTSITCFLGLCAFFLLRPLLQSNDLGEKQIVASKRKKARKVGNKKNNVNAEKNNSTMLSVEEEKAIGLQFVGRNDNKPLLDLMKPFNGGSNGRMIGKLFVSNVEIAKGSNGTVVFEGNYEGRPVAIKRLVKSHHDVALKEIQNLIASDQHPNIIRWFGVESDSDFVYLSLERCMCSLNDLIQICSGSSQSSVFLEDQNANSINEYNVRLDSLQGIDKDIELWKANGYPSPQLLRMMRDVVSGLAHLHELGIIHRDLKPQNVLILKQRSICAKLSDMGISKRLIDDMSSLGHHATGSGSSGWQAPEQLLLGRQTRAVDLFSLGCVIFFCITGGKHPFGDRLERDINIVKNHVDLFMVEHIPEAVDLLSRLLDSDPELRPKAVDVLHHPLFWDSETRLSFLRDTSDRVELEDRESESDLLNALESVAPAALGGMWDEKLETAFITNIGRYRRYKFDSLRDLLRVVRNKLNHYRELPKDIQELLGVVPEGFDGYFASRFPRFLIEVYKVMYKFCREEECFSKYFKSNQS